MRKRITCWVIWCLTGYASIGQIQLEDQIQLPYDHSLTWTKLIAGDESLVHLVAADGHGNWDLQTYDPDLVLKEHASLPMTDFKLWDAFWWKGALWLAGYQQDKPFVGRWITETKELDMLALPFHFQTFSAPIQVSEAELNLIVTDQGQDMVIRWQPEARKWKVLDLFPHHDGRVFHMVQTPFAEMYLLVSAPHLAGEGMVLLKFNEQGDKMWQESYPALDFQTVAFQLMPSGDLLACANNQVGFRSTVAYVHWAPDGTLLQTHSITGEEKQVATGFGLLEGTALWQIQESTAFGSRTSQIEFLTIENGQYDIQSSLSLGSKRSDHVLASCSIREGQVIVLRGQGNLTNYTLQKVAFMEDICRKPWATGEVVRVRVQSSNYLPKTDEVFQFKALITTQEPLTIRDVRLFPLTSAEKIPGIIKLKLLDSVPTHYCYQLEKTFYLRGGANALALQIGTPTRWQDTFTIYRLPQRPDLYLISIGVVSGDLSYTSKDAADVAALFKNQNGRLFNEVHARLLNTREATDREQLLEALHGFLSGQTIEDKDVIICFISSHGDLIAGDFSILAADYNPLSNTGILSFRKDLMDQLEKLPGKKIFFLDACKSGGIKGSQEVTPNLISSIFQVVSTDPGITAISSSSDDQSSYELSDLENGAFTAALKEACGSSFTACDTNGDQVITLAELFAYLQIRIPDLIQTYLKDPRKKQNPAIPLQDLSLEIPLYFKAN